MTSMIHSMDKAKSKNTTVVVITIVAALFLGAISGYIIKKSTSSSSLLPAGVGQIAKETGSSSTYGTKDTKLYPDSATGTVRAGGIEGEGTHHLERPGGPSQNVYITSSSVDLGVIEGKKVTVWGKTYAGNKAGWLMDVGYVEVK